MELQLLKTKTKLYAAGILLLAASAVTAQTTTFNYTGSVQTYTVGVGVTSIQLETWGAQGSGGNGGLGGYAKGTMTVTPGQVLNVYVGGQTGYNGGGLGHASLNRNGGGASDVRVSPYALADRVIVAGAGGGGGPTDVGIRNGGTGGGGTVGSNYAGGGGGDGYGGNGQPGGLNGGAGNTSCHSGGAGGGGLNSGGAASCNTCYTSSCGQAGSLGQGGNGDTWENGICFTSYGGTNGGGGGYYGGGGSSVGNCGGGGGGGGSSWVGTLTATTLTGGIRSGNGQVVITVLTVCVGPTVSSNPANTLVCAGGNTSLSVASSGATGWQWEVDMGAGFVTVNNAAPYSGATTQTLTITGAVAGMNGYIYRCVAIGAACNTNSSNATLTVSNPIVTLSSQTNNTCFGGSAGSITANNASGGIGTYTYDWTPGTPTGDGTTTITGLTSGTWSCTVTDSLGCNATMTATITSPSAITITSSVSAIACNGGTATVTLTPTGGNSPYTGAGPFTVTAGTYTYTVTDANGCTSTTAVTVTEPGVFTTAITTTQPSTCGGSDGSINLSVIGATPNYTFLWSNSASTEDLSGLAEGSYTCVITDANGCTTSDSAQLTDPTPPTVALAFAIDTVCSNDGLYAISGATPAGGTFSGTGVSGNNFDPATASIGINVITYSYTDANGCSGTATDSVYVDICLGLNNTNSNTTFTVLPNPNNGTFVVNLNSTSTASVEIYSAVGQLVSVQQIQPNMNEQITIETSGVYFITVIESDGKRSTQRVVVNK